MSRQLRAQAFWVTTVVCIATIGQMRPEMATSAGATLMGMTLAVITGGLLQR